MPYLYRGICSLKIYQMCEMDIDKIQRIDRETHLQWPRKYYTKVLTSHNYHAYCAQMNNQCVGSIMFRIKNKELYIDKLVVIKKLQHQGIGGELIEKALRTGKKYTVDVAFLSVSSRNFSAIDFYMKHGFQLECIQWNHYDHQDHGLKMYRNLQTNHE